MTDYYELLGFAIANLGISAREFWRMTMREYAAAHKAWLRMNGFDEAAPQQMSRDEMAELANL
ncbi:MAG: phage tail assembly chaperone [Rhizobiales bacterium]|nr:phage tail assembly chaperone [Hyphomicrobiales bacterium]NRB15044.1 phage tail assembly chaperone [Hyphomicrobiales bacterium]